MVDNMADITICKNEDCIIREDCYRYMVLPDDKYQSYAIFLPNQRGSCDHYVPLRKPHPL